MVPVQDPLKNIEDSLLVIREEARQAGFAAGFEQGFAAALGRVRSMIDQEAAVVPDGNATLGEVFSAAIQHDRKRRKKGQSKALALAVLRQSGEPITISDILRAIKAAHGQNIAYSSMRHAMTDLQEEGEVAVEDNLWRLASPIRPS